MKMVLSPVIMTGDIWLMPARESNHMLLTKHITFTPTFLLILRVVFSCLFCIFASREERHERNY